MKNLNNLHMTASYGSISVVWTRDDGSRHHVWLEAKDYEPVRPFRVKKERSLGTTTVKATLYHNPPAGESAWPNGTRGARKKDAEAAANDAMVTEALRRAEAEGMFEAAVEAAKQADHAKTQAARAERVAKMRDQLHDRRNRLLGTNRPQALNLLDAMLASSDDDVLEFSHLG